MVWDSTHARQAPLKVGAKRARTEGKLVDISEVKGILVTSAICMAGRALETAETAVQ